MLVLNAETFASVISRPGRSQLHPDLLCALCADAGPRAEVAPYSSQQAR